MSAFGRSSIVRFGIVGAVNTSIDFAVFFSLVYVLGFEAVAANAFSYLAAVVNSYFMNFLWTFRVGRLSEVTFSSFSLFFLCSCVGLAVGSGIIYWLSPLLGVEVVKLMSVSIVFVVNFFLSKTVLMGKEPGRA